MRSISSRLMALALAGAGALFALAASAVTSTATRPQLSDDEAAEYTSAAYLAQGGTIGSLTTDHWNPTEGLDAFHRFVHGFMADYTVAADGSTPYRTVQSAIDAAIASGSAATRKYIGVKAGTYTEMVCIPASAPPITLFGTGGSPNATVIVFGNGNPTPKTVGRATSACFDNASSATVGTASSATVKTLAAGFQAHDLTIRNSYVPGTYSGDNQSAMALSIQADKAVLENVVLTSFQDTLHIGSVDARSTAIIRAFVRHSFIQGDMDFIFGSGTVVFDGCEIRYTGERLGPTHPGLVFAPSTRPGNPHGFLVLRSVFDSVGDVPAHSIYLGRAWDQSVNGLSNYLNGISPNGQIAIRESMLGEHIRLPDPWTTATTGRRYCAADCTYSPNRFFEYKNIGPGSGN